MKGRILLLTFLPSTWLVIAGPVFHGLAHAQTIESQDTRTFQDSRGQDSRQSPAIIPPGEAERLKKLTEQAIVPDETKESAPAEPPDNSKRDSATPRNRTPPAKRE